MWLCSEGSGSVGAASRGLLLRWLVHRHPSASGGIIPEMVAAIRAGDESGVPGWERKAMRFVIGHFSSFNMPSAEDGRRPLPQARMCMRMRLMLLYVHAHTLATQVYTHPLCSFRWETKTSRSHPQTQLQSRKRSSSSNWSKISRNSSRDRSHRPTSSTGQSCSWCASALMPCTSLALPWARRG